MSALGRRSIPKSSSVFIADYLRNPNKGSGASGSGGGGPTGGSGSTPVPLVTSIVQTSNFTSIPTINTYFLDTSGGAWTVTLNATPSLNEVVEVWDSTGFAGSNPVSFNGNGKNIAGIGTVPAFITISYGSARLIYNGTQWLVR